MGDYWKWDKIILSAEFEFFGDLLVALQVIVVEIIQESATTPDKHEKAPTCAEILGMLFQVVGEVVDTLG